MMKSSMQELNDKLKWTLPQKIDHSLHIIEAFNNEYPNCVISFSGGIDSLVMLFLIRMIDKTKKGIFVNTTNEHSEIVRFMNKIENIETITPKITFITVLQQYGFPLISKKVASQLRVLQHPTKENEASRNLYLTGVKKDGTKNNAFILPDKYRHLIQAPFNFSEQCCDHLKKKPFKTYQKEGVFIGTKVSDSRNRLFGYLKVGGCINTKAKKCQPLSIWTKRDVWNFIKQNHLEYCDVYDKGEQATGCAYCGFGCQFDRTRFARLKEREPKRWVIIMNVKNNGVTYKEAIETTFKICTEHYQHTFFQNLH